MKQPTWLSAALRLAVAHLSDVRRLGSLARILVVIVVCTLSAGNLLAPLQEFLEDQRFGVVTRQPSGQVVLLDIDETSIRKMGVWPWKRTVHADIVDRLRVLGATDIAFDIDFSSPSTPDADAALEAALKRADGSVVLAALQQAARPGLDGHAALLESRPLARFADQGWEGSVDVWPDPDGRIRWFSRGEAFGSTMLPSLATLLGSASGAASGRFMIDFSIDAGQLQHISVADLLGGTIEPALVRGRKVIVGASAVELRDYFQVPRFGLLAGSMLQAMAAESLLQGRALQPLGMWPTLLSTVLLLVGAGLAAERLSYGRFLAACIGLAGLVEGGAIALQTLRPLLLVTAPVQAGLVAFACIAVAVEIGERRVKLIASRQQANRLRIILDRVVADNFAGIIVVDHCGLIRAASTAAGTILGSDVPAGRSFRQVLPDALAGLVSQASDQGANGTPQAGPSCEVELAGAGGRPAILNCMTTVSDLGDASGSDRSAGVYAVCLTFKDVTEERRTQLRLAELAHTDALSGLANRTVFLDYVETSSVQGGNPSAVILFDIDRFKLVNDRLGHAAGDALIQAVAARVRSALEPGDIAARLGGDEFAMWVRRHSRRDVQAFAERLVRDLAGSYEIGRYQPWIAISLGMVFAEGQTTKDLMSCADTALYEAKAAGGDEVRLYDAAMKAKAEGSRQLELDLRSALGRAEFQVHYQRQVDIVSEEIIGVEALVRWTHPELGPVSPAEFIPIAERTGLIEPIGAWVLATACRDAARWPIPIKVSVNISAVQLARANLADCIFETLAQTGLPPSRLDLELTESLLMENDELVRNTLGRLRAAGVKISLDDFGTGYSSLSYLNTFSIDKVKIDQSFVRALADTPSASAIIRAVVSLARDLGLRVNAEGIETAEQMRMLRQLGCDEVQGYLHGRPEPSLAIEIDLDSQNKRAA